MSAALLTRVQRGLEALYRVATGVEIGDFLVDEGVRDDLAPARRPREQLFLHEEDGELALGLFIDRPALQNLSARDPGAGLDDENLGDFLLALEGVSHFVYAVCCARDRRPVSALELELQAEVDKYVTCLLVGGASPASTDRSARLRTRLFADADYLPDLDADERARYRAANDNAHRYAAWLEARFVARDKIPEMLCELRRFYRRPLAAKLGVIARAA